jgi:hypothetical protein
MGALLIAERESPKRLGGPGSNALLRFCHHTKRMANYREICHRSAMRNIALQQIGV